MRSARLLSVLCGTSLLLSVLGACDEPAESPPAPDVDAGDVELPDAGRPPPPPQRCDIPLERFFAEGTGATRAQKIKSRLELLEGPNAHGKIGDYLLENDRIRVVLQAADRHIGPLPFGASIIDADLVRPGEPGRDQFGELGLIYNLGRTINPTFFEVLSPGGVGEPAIVAMSGRDTVQDYLRIKNILKQQAQLPVLDADRPLPLRITSYFILNPGEQRVRYVTAFCNEGDQEEGMLVGDLSDPGYVVDLFNGQACTGGFGYGGMCAGLDRASWYGYQGDGVAYGWAPYKAGAPGIPEPTNAILTFSAVTGSLIGADGLAGLTEWFDPNMERRSGEMRLPARGTQVIARDFFVARDLGEIATLGETSRAAVKGTPLGDLSGEVKSGGKSLAGAKVSVVRGTEIAGVFVTDEEGRFQGRFAAGTYTVAAWAPARIPTPDVTVTLRPEEPVTLSMTLGETRTLTVRVRDPSGTPLPAKVTVICASGICPAPNRQLIRFFDAGKDPLPDNLQLVGFVPPVGEQSFSVPPGAYRVLVSRGPEYSVFPNDFRSSGGAFRDLGDGDATVEAVIARVIDTTGYMSADFHVHGVNSPDSMVDNASRALTFLAEGTDILVATDHDFYTDYSEDIRALKGEGLLATFVGVEMSPVDFGHFNAFPFVPDPTDPITAGVIDWGGGLGDSFTPAQIFSAARQAGARTVIINHPRGYLGVFTNLGADLDTLATHADPVDFCMAPQPGATPADTRLLSTDFDVVEVLNAGVDELSPVAARPVFNDWFTLLSRGIKVAGIGASDSHQRWATAVAYPRTFVGVGLDEAPALTSSAVSAALRRVDAVTTSAPFVRIEARRVDTSGAPTSATARMGEVVAASSDDVEVVVEVQVPEYLDVSRIELYMHTPGDDARCPIAPGSPESKTTRVACGGQSNLNWPAPLRAADVTLRPEHRVVVTRDGSTELARWQVREVFRIPAPATDNWIVVLVHGSRPLFPLAWPSKLSGGSLKEAKPFAFTNPIFVDADGGGFDHPPFSPPTRSQAPLPPRAPKPTRPPTAEELVEMWRAAQD